jgi:hypothetical protein
VNRSGQSQNPLSWTALGSAVGGGGRQAPDQPSSLLSAWVSSFVLVSLVSLRITAKFLPQPKTPLRVPDPWTKCGVNISLWGRIR